MLSQYRTLLRATIERLRASRLGVQTADIEQEACLRVLLALRGETKIREVASYLYRVAVNATIDATRRVQARREEQLGSEADHESESAALPPSPERSPEERVGDRELADAIRQALGKLARNRQRAVRLHLQGLLRTEIATLAGWTEAKTRNLVSRGLVDLRRELRAMGIDGDLD